MTAGFAVRPTVSLRKRLPLRHFRQVQGPRLRELFHQQPEPVVDRHDRELLAVALGATLYAPATRPDLVRGIQRGAARGVCSMVIDLEDAVPDSEAPAAQRQAVRALDLLAASEESNPLLFVRVREPEAVRQIAGALGAGAAALTGFVFPKFTAVRGPEYLAALNEAADMLERPLYGMPVLESPVLVHRETRDRELLRIARLLDRHRERVLAVRVGATDLCSAFGIRRDRERTVYDVRVVADVIADIVNYLGRADGSGFVITGPVWEYFAGHRGREADGLLREIALDRANGMQGKTVIHPGQVAAVHAMSVVTHEEYTDACEILRGADGGVAASAYANKMNEMRPHRNWARRTLLRARVFGVARREVSFAELLTAAAVG
ncbi:ATP/GTP-binding protein [Nocardia panacis]|uniref:ATP/GTP-binding protein n=1 Tax=Nocardia panacis TaxID=2340916 RepID=A0A3A4KNF7_9NOCA|nr:HpcH/HpaI aldolase/citrate lyase family protein [Nocardia panacis]RJO76887.1 ATP/GTP-binding protein [Nocardia panacis]